jgi:hypothetical protein
LRRGSTGAVFCGRHQRDARVHGLVPARGTGSTDTGSERHREPDDRLRWIFELARRIPGRGRQARRGDRVPSELRFPVCPSGSGHARRQHRRRHHVRPAITGSGPDHSRPAGRGISARSILVGAAPSASAGDGDPCAVSAGGPREATDGPRGGRLGSARAGGPKWLTSSRGGAHPFPHDAGGSGPMGTPRRPRELAAPGRPGDAGDAGGASARPSGRGRCGRGHESEAAAALLRSATASQPCPAALPGSAAAVQPSQGILAARERHAGRAGGHGPGRCHAGLGSQPRPALWPAPAPLSAACNARPGL